MALLGCQTALVLSPIKAEAGMAVTPLKLETGDSFRSTNEHQ
jgi:hypothetical protein